MDLVKVEIDPNQESGEIKLSDQQIRLANIQTDTVRFYPLGEERTLSATLKENQAGINIISSKIEGRIERLFVRNEGEMVNKGQALFTLYSERLSVAQQDYLLALKNENRYAGSDFDFKQLADAARNKLLLWGMTEKQIKEIEMTGEVKNFVTFYSKYNGYVTGVSAEEGDYVMEGSIILNLADLSTLWVDAQLYVTDLPFLNKQQEALVEIPSFPGRMLKGKVSFINPELKASSKIVLLRVEIKNPLGEYQPGMQAWITLKSEAINVVAVPTHALIQGKDGATIWIRNANGGFENKMVTIGKTNRDFTEIVNGLQSGEVIVVSGAYLLNSEYVFKRGTNPMEGHEM